MATSIVYNPSNSISSIEFEESKIDNKSPTIKPSGNPTDGLFRTYDGQNEMVMRTYRDMIQKQTLAYVLEKKKEYSGNFKDLKLGLWEVFAELDTIIDESDPDNDLPQYVHAFQTGLSIQNRYYDENGNFKRDIEIKSLFYKEWDSLPENVRKMYENAKYIHNLYPEINDWDFFILVGFIHDLGKVLLSNRFGGLPQWSVVGDIFPVGCKYNEACVFHDFNFQSENPDYSDPVLNSELGIYSKNCGFDNLQMAFSHDEYLASVLEKNDTNFPKEAMYTIRYHSFYPWHTSKSGTRGYEYFATEYDWKMLPLVKALQKADLYSKSRDIPSLSEAKEKYNFLINKYFNTELIKW